MLACAVLAVALAVSDPPPRARVVLCGLSAATAAQLEAACGAQADVVVRQVGLNGLRDAIAADQAAVVMAFGFPVTSLRAAVRAQVLAPVPAAVAIACADLVDAERSAIPLFIDPVVIARGGASSAAWLPAWDALEPALEATGVADAVVFETLRPGTASAAWFASLDARDGAGARERFAALLRAAGPNLVGDAQAVVDRVAALGPRALAVVRRSDARRDPRLVFDDLAQAGVEAPAVLLGCAFGFGASGVDPAWIAALTHRDLAQRVAEAEGLLLAQPVDATPAEVGPTRRLLARTIELEDEVLAALAQRRHDDGSKSAESVSEWFDVIAMVGLVAAVTVYLWRRRRIDAATG